MEWKNVSPEEAAENKYYGLGGWLLFFYVLAVLIFLASFLNLANVSMFKQVYGGAYGLMIVVSIVQGLLLLPFIILAPKKNPLMPKATISALWFSVALTAIAGIITGPTAMMGQLIVGVISVFLFSLYLKKSKRVNVTYHHQVPVETEQSSQ